MKITAKWVAWINRRAKKLCRIIGHDYMSVESTPHAACCRRCGKWESQWLRIDWHKIEQEQSK